MNSEAQGSDRRGPEVLEGRGEYKLAPHPQSGAHRPAPPWVPDRKYVKLKVSQKHRKFYGSHDNVPRGVSQQPLPFSVLRAGNRPLLLVGGDTFGDLNQ